MGVENVIVARTDAEAATLLTSTIDSRDHFFILGSTNKNLEPLNDVMNSARSKGLTGVKLQEVEDKWLVAADIKLYSEAVSESLKAIGKSIQIQNFIEQSTKMSFSESKNLAKSLGVDPYYCWNSPRTSEGFYRYQGGTPACINRGVAYAKYADLIWMETKSPIYKQAQQFALGVHKVLPETMLAYNLSPSFNWDSAGMSDDEIKNFITNLAKLGFNWQFITLAGVNLNLTIVPF
jgi:isocitrate lyase